MAELESTSALAELEAQARAEGEFQLELEAQRGRVACIRCGATYEAMEAKCTALPAEICPGRAAADAVRRHGEGLVLNRRRLERTGRLEERRPERRGVV